MPDQLIIITMADIRWRRCFVTIQRADGWVFIWRLGRQPRGHRYQCSPKNALRLVRAIDRHVAIMTALRNSGHPIFWDAVNAPMPFAAN